MLNLPRSCALSLSLLISGAGWAGVNSWTVTGPEGGPVASVAIHPTEPETALIGSARGVHLSLTQGAFWARMFPGDINDISDLMYDASQSQRVYARGNQLYRSDDDARTFVLVTPGIANLSAMAIGRDGVLYVTTLYGRMLRSSNAGGQWSELSVPWNDPVGRAHIAVDPGNSAIVYAVLPDVGTYKSTDAGATWSDPLPGSPGTRDVLDIAQHFAIDPTDGARLIVATPNGLMRSIDGGLTWTSHLTGEGYVWVGFDPLAPAEVVALDRYGQIMRSLDRGATWPLNLRPPRLPVHAAYAMALSPTTSGLLWVATSEGPMFSDDFGASFERRVTNFVTGIPAALSAADDGTVYGALSFPSGIFTRSGQNWWPVNNAPLLDAAPGASTLRSVAVAPRDSSRLYAIDMGRRLMRSTNAGQTWSGPHPQFATMPNVIATVVADPVNPLVAYLSTSASELWRTADGGDTWQVRAALPAIGDLLAVGVNNPDVMYASVLTTPSTLGVVRSVDAGLNWAPTAALPSSEVRGITIDPLDADVVYVILQLGMLKSTNGGASWTELDFGLPQGSYFVGGAMVVDPVYSQTLIASTSQPDLGFLRSIDGGTTWQRTPLNLGGVRTWVDRMTLNPQRPGLLIAGVSHSGFLEYEISPDLEVTLTGLDNRVAAGGSAAVQVVVQNHGPHAASPSHVALTLPAHLSLAPPLGCGLVASTLHCDVGALPVGATQTINLTFAIAATPASGFIRADLTGHEPDSVGGNNVATAGAISEHQSNLAVTLSTVPMVTSGNSTSFTATVTNSGPHDSPNTHLEIELAAGLFAQTATTTQGSCIANGSVITTWICELGTLNSGATATVTVNIRGDTVATHTISAGVAGLNIDPVSGNDAASTTVRVNPAPPPPRESGGGGGGRLDWLALLLLAGVLVSRARLPAPARR